MKIVKYVLLGLFVITGFMYMTNSQYFAGLCFLLLGLILFPNVSSFLKQKLKIWNNKFVRYAAYVILFLIAGSTADVSALSKSLDADVKTTQSTKGETVSVENSHLKTCNMLGDKSFVIPELIAADVYPNFEKLGFKVDKQIKTEGTMIFCEQTSTSKKFNLRISGCSPTEIVEISALGTDITGSNQNEIKSFLGYVATLQYQDSKPNEARKWVEENYKNDGAKKIIGDVTFEIGAKTKNASRLLMYVDFQK